MRRVAGCSLWIGPAGDLRDPRLLAEAGLAAAVDLALNEPPAVVRRDLVACRFPLVDGAGNPPWLLRAAVATVAGLVRDDVPTLVCCGGGMSAAPAVAAAALARARGIDPDEALRLTTRDAPADVSPALWREFRAATRGRDPGQDVPAGIDP